MNKGNGLQRLAELLAENLSGADIIEGRELGKISTQISRWRVNQNMTQKEFAEFMGVTQGMVSKWESKDYNFTIASLAQIADKTGMKLEVSLAPEITGYNEIRKYNDNKWSITLENQNSTNGVA